MSKNLTTSKLDRQNILNNEKALDEIQKQTGIQGVIFENKVYFTKMMVSTYFEVDVRTIERYVSENVDELSSNGYEIIKGKRLKNFVDEIEKMDVPDINVGNISKHTPQLAIFVNILKKSQPLGPAPNCDIKYHPRQVVFYHSLEHPVNQNCCS